MDDIHSLIYGILGGLTVVASTAIGVANWLNHRFSTADTKLSVLAQQLTLEMQKLKGEQELGRSGEVSHWEMLDYKTNANKELIEHRTKRFMDELKALETRVCADVDEVKQFLAKTTEFTIRGAGRQ